MPGSSPSAELGQGRGIAILPEAVRRARLEAGLSLGQVAQPELTRGFIWLIEQGRTRPSISTLRQIASRTGRPLSFFLAQTEASDEQRADSSRLKVLVDKEEFEQAVELGTRLLADDDLPSHIEAEMRLQMGRAYVRRGEGRLAETHLIRAEQLCELTGDRRLVAEVLDALGCALFLADDPRMLRVGWDALHAAERVASPRDGLLVEVLLHLGSFLLCVRDWQRAVECYERALDLSQAAPNMRHIAMLHDQLAVALQWLGRPVTARKHMERARRGYEATKDAADAIRAEANWGWLLMKQGRLDEAVAYLQSALLMCDRQHVDLQGAARGNVLGSLAEAHILRGDLDDAERLLDESMERAVAHKQVGLQASTSQLRGLLHAKREDYERAADEYERAARDFEQLNRFADAAEALDRRASVLMKLELVKEAADCWRRAAALA